MFVFYNKFVDHGSRHGDVAQALAQWRHPVASSETQDVFYQGMHPTLYQHIRMVIKITSNFPAFLVFVDFVVTHNCR